MLVTQNNDIASIAVLSSGGLDSCVLIYELSRTQTVFPIYIEQGLAWEQQELKALGKYISALSSKSIRPVVKLKMPVKEIYGDHWSVTGENIPSSSEPDEKVYLPGRNIFLLAAAGVWCSINEVHKIALGSLAGNPFPDATSDFFDDFAKLLSIATSAPIQINAPYRGMSKPSLIKKFKNLPLELTLTCNAPENGHHCGKCNKCHERQSAFTLANVIDRTYYGNK